MHWHSSCRQPADFRHGLWSNLDSMPTLQVLLQPKLPSIRSTKSRNSLVTILSIRLLYKASMENAYIKYNAWMVVQLKGLLLRKSSLYCHIIINPTHRLIQVLYGCSDDSQGSREGKYGAIAGILSLNKDLRSLIL